MAVTLFSFTSYCSLAQTQSPSWTTLVVDLQNLPAKLPATRLGNFINFGSVMLIG
jgi:hypothetical protein